MLLTMALAMTIVAMRERRYDTANGHVVSDIDDSHDCERKNICGDGRDAGGG